MIELFTLKSLHEQHSTAATIRNVEMRNPNNQDVAFTLIGNSNTKVSECDLDENLVDMWDVGSDCMARFTVSGAQTPDTFLFNCPECAASLEIELHGFKTCPLCPDNKRYCLVQECRLIRIDVTALSEQLSKSKEAATFEGDLTTLLSETCRKEIYAILIQAKIEGMAIPLSKVTIADPFFLSCNQLEAIQKEGIEKEWP